LDESLRGFDDAETQTLCASSEIIKQSRNIIGVPSL
jgi:hypothetical protein